MAADTRNKRFSMVGLGLPLGFPVANPATGVSASDRLMLLFLYAGIGLSEPFVLEAGPERSLLVLGEQRALAVSAESRTLLVTR
jgi:hypothetical protein